MVPRKNVGLAKFCQDLEISKAFLISLEVSFLSGLIFTFLSSKLFTKESRARIFNKNLGVSASLGFYHSPPLEFDIFVICRVFMYCLSSFLLQDMFSSLHELPLRRPNMKFTVNMHVAYFVAPGPVVIKTV